MTRSNVLIKFKGFDEGCGVSAVSNTFQLELCPYLMVKIRGLFLSATR